MAGRDLRPAVSADVLLGAVGAGVVRVTSVSIHPADLARFDIERLRATFGGAIILPSIAVERGWAYVNSRSVGGR